jgi:hypothetical protein
VTTSANKWPSLSDFIKSADILAALSSFKQRFQVAAIGIKTWHLTKENK